jgi:hypothetical protein
MAQSKLEQPIALVKACKDICSHFLLFNKVLVEVLSMGDEESDTGAYICINGHGHDSQEQGRMIESSESRRP